jgi:6-phosphogluconolactonase
MNTLKQDIQIERVKNTDALAEHALTHFMDSCRESIKHHDVFYTAISGGHTPILFYEKLSKRAVHSQMDWKKVHLFWVDERCVEPSGPASNFGLAVRTFLQEVPIPFENIHRVTGEVADLSKAAENYQRTIRETMQVNPDAIPAFDLIILGMGSDGHIGSIFPNTYALFDTEDLVCTVFRMEGDHSRITLTIPVLKAARRLMILVSGPEKAQTLKNVFSTDPDPVLYPVHALWPVLDKVTWIVDEGAGSLL